MRIFQFGVIFILLTLSFVSAATFNFETTSDKLEINEEFGDVVPVIKAAELSNLESSSITTDQGSTITNQYLRFGGASSSLSPPKINYIKSDDNGIGSFIYINQGSSSTDAFFELEVEFVSGLESSISSTNNLVDMEDAKFKIFADEYTIVDTEINTGTAEVSLLLSTSAVTDLAKEGSTAIHQIGNNKYEVKVESVTSSPEQVRLIVNGEDIGSLAEDEYHIFPDGTILGVRDIITSSGSSPDLANIYIGAKVLEFSDKYSDTTFEQGFSLNKEKISNGYVSISGSISNDIFKISSLKYRAISNIEVYVPENKRLADTIEDNFPLLGNWDIIYNGLEDVTETQVIIDSTDDFDYDLTFKNQDGESYKFPFYYKDGTLGDVTQKFYIKEGTSTTNALISLKDYFILSSGSSKSDKSYILQYDSIDTTNKKVTFKKVLSNTPATVTASYNAPTANLTGQGTVTVGGTVFDFYIENYTTRKLSIDQDNDGNVEGDSADLIIEGGGIIDLGTSNSPGTTYTLKLTTTSSLFEESTTDEAITFQLSGGTTVGISSTTFTNVNLYNNGDVSTGMTDYGAFFTLTNFNSANAGKLEIDYPMKQRFGDVQIELLKSTSEAITTQILSTCFDSIINGGETGVDCGGPCQPCEAVLCNNGLQDSGEEGVDCGGICSTPCQVQQESETTTTTPLETQDNSECPTGCLYVDDNEQVICLESGEITKKLYCAGQDDLKERKKNGLFCANGIECLSGTCENETCGKDFDNISAALNIFFIILVILVLFRVHAALKPPQ